MINNLLVKICLLLLLMGAGRTYAQAPQIIYQTPQKYIINTAITPLVPTNSGGTVPATNYGEVSTFAGNGTTGANNGTGTAASFDRPAGLSFDASGNLFVADYGNALIRKITPTGVVTTFAGNATKATVNGLGTAASFINPNGITFDALGNMYVSDETGHVIRLITPAGLVTTFAGTGVVGAGNGLAATATFANLGSIATDAAGNVYVADVGNNLIRKIAGGLVSTFAGSGAAGTVNGTGTAATFNGPFGLTIDAAGNVYVGEIGGNVVRKITPAGQVSILAGNGSYGSANGSGATASFGSPLGLTFDAGGNIIEADYNTNYIRKISMAAQVSTVSGSGIPGSVDGLATAARFYRPRALAVKNGELFVAEFTGNIIRKVLLTGYTIDKPLPAGLAFDGKTGRITGTPTAVTPADTYTITAYNADGSSSANLNIEVLGVALLPSVITFPATQPGLDANSNYNPGATSTNIETPIVYTSSNTAVATVLPSGLVHIVANGTTVITANQAGNANYSPAVPVPKTLNVSQQNIITFAELPRKRPDDADFTPDVTSSITSYPIVLTSNNPAVATIVNGQIHIVGEGTSVITASQAIDDTYVATPVSRTLTVSNFIFPVIPTKNTCDGDFDPGATNILPITYTSGNTAVAIIAGGKVHIVGSGTVLITATSGGEDLQQPLTVEAVSVPTVGIAASVQTAICNGATVTFTAEVKFAGTSPFYQWKVNGANVSTNNYLYTTANLQDNDVVTCVVTNTQTNCVVAPTVTSNAIPVKVTPLNTATVNVQYDNTPVCAGIPVTFTAQQTGGGSSPTYQWRVNNVSKNIGTSTYTAALNNGDVVTCVLTSNIPCTAPVTSAPVAVQVYPLPAVNFSGGAVAINKGNNIQLRPVITGDIAEYKWTPSTGLSSASAASPIATPTVTTIYQLQVKSTSGCYASASVTVNVLTTLVVYNTFSPNGDYINDTWKIPSLEYYPNCLVSITNRYGEVVYQSRGYSKPWDGTKNGQPLPLGTYYYIIDLKNNKPLVSGSVTIIR